MKPGEEVVSVNVSWTVEKFVAEEKKEPSRKAQGTSGKKKEGKKPVKAKAPAAKKAVTKAKPTKKKK